MRRALLIVGGLVLAMSAARVARAQEPADTMMMDDNDTVAAAQLREQIEQRFAERVRARLALSDDQMKRLQAVHQRFGPQRRELARRYVENERALRGQMRPGVAANPDSVRAYLDVQQRLRAEQLELERAEDRELSTFLTPVQRAQLLQMRRNLQSFVNRVREGRQGQGRVRDGVGPRPRPRGRPAPARPPRRRP